MIYKIKKQLYKQDDFFAIRSAIGEVLCSVKPIKLGADTVGYYIYNTSGEGIAQVTFDGNEATLAIARQRGYFPGALKLVRNGNKFVFKPSLLSPEDEVFAKNLQGQVDKDYTIWGNGVDYSYDIYYGSEVAANVVRNTDDDTMFSVNVHAEGNVITVISACLAVEKLAEGVQK